MKVEIIYPVEGVRVLSCVQYEPPLPLDEGYKAALGLLPATIDALSSEDRAEIKVWQEVSDEAWRMIDEWERGSLRDEG